MCRSIKTLRGLEPTASDEDIRAAALQFVRKISGYRKPSRVNQSIFDAAVDEIAASSRRLLEGLGGTGNSHSVSTMPIPRSISVRKPA
jgi:hypothetical protein